MSIQDNFDRALVSWLSEGPNRLPEAAVDRIVGDIERIDTRKPAWFPARETVNRLVLSFGGVAVLVLVVIGAAYYLNPSGVGGPDGKLFSSSRYGYTLRISTNWTVSQTAGEWTANDYFNSLPTPGADEFVDPNNVNTTRFMNSQPIGDMTPEQWTTRYLARHKAFFSNCHDMGTTPLHVGGVDGTILESDCSGTGAGPIDVAQLTLVHEGRGYVFRVLSANGSADEKAVLKSWVASLGWTEITATP